MNLPNEEPIEGRVISKNEIIDNDGNKHISKNIPEEYLGEKVVIRGNKVNRRIDS